MTHSSTPLPASRSLLDMVERASLFALLQQAMQYQKRPQQLPSALHADLGLPPAGDPAMPPAATNMLAARNAP